MKLPMTRTRLLSPVKFASVTALAWVLLASSAAMAQDRSGGGFLDNLFNRGQPAQEQPQQQSQQQRPYTEGASGVDARIDRLEAALRQLTGTVEELQHQNQQLQMQLKRLQDDTDYRLRQYGSHGAAPPPASGPARMSNPAPISAAPDNQKGDAFNPSMHPSAPGAPHSLGGGGRVAPPPPGQSGMNVPPIGAPNGRNAGEPLDLSSLAGPGPAPQYGNGAQYGNGSQNGNRQLPAPPPRNPSATGTQLATLPPSASPKDEYELAYGYVLHKDYNLAAQQFRDFLRKYPNEKLAPEAQYWLGESLFQQQSYTDAAKEFLNVATKYGHSSKAPEALLRLGQSLAALHKKEAACATLAEVGRKFPHASTSVRRGVAQEQKRAHC